VLEKVGERKAQQETITLTHYHLSVFLYVCMPAFLKVFSPNKVLPSNRPFVVFDFAVDSFGIEMEITIFAITWIVWVIAAIVLNMIFMKFIIAVISESSKQRPSR
jgi:hypothetical protein